MTEIKKLEIKHIASYLPYGLQWYHKNRDRTYPITFYNANTIVHAVNNQNYKIVLRPMSDLYKERNGKIDIVELAKIAFPNDDWELDSNGKEAISTNGMTYYFGYDLGDFYAGDGWDAYKIANQLELFEYLFANHYDVFDLPQELWINKNDIE